MMHPSRRRRFGAVVTVLILAEVVSAFELSMMYVALPTLIREFKVDAGTAAWVVTAYLLVSASAGVLGGRFGDLYGRRKVLVVALVLAGVGSLVSLVGGSLLMIILGRAIQGSAGAVMGLAFGLAREHLEKERVPIGVSMIGASALIAGAFGAFIAGFMVQVFSWHGIFAFAAVLALVAVVAVFAVIPRDHVIPTRQRPDLIGAVTLPIAASCMLLGLGEITKAGWSSPQFLGLAGASVVVGALWVWWELRVPAPIVNLRMLKNRQIALIMSATLLAALGPIGGFAVPSQMVLQYPAATGYGLGFTAANAGLLSCGAAFLGYLFSPLGGRLAQRLGAKFVFVAGLVLITAVIPAIFLAYGSVWVFVAAMSLNTIGISLTYGALPNVLIEAVPEAFTSETAGANTMVRNIGQSAATAIGAVILAAHQDPKTILVAQDGVTAALSVLFVFGVLAVVLGLLLKREPKQWTPPAGAVSAEPALAEDTTR